MDGEALQYWHQTVGKTVKVVKEAEDSFFKRRTVVIVGFTDGTYIAEAVENKPGPVMPEQLSREDAVALNVCTGEEWDRVKNDLELYRTLQRTYGGRR